MKGRRPHLESITILRGLAALGVVLFHVRIFLWVGWNEIRNNPHEYSALERLVSWLSIPTPFLGEGVLLFFVISGFCIHYPQAGQSEKLDLQNYFCRRFFRIYPPFVAAVGLSLVVVAFLPWGEVTREPILPSLLLIQNYFPGVNSQISTNFSLWSIATEAELYLAYPFMLLIWRKWGMAQSLNIFGAISVVAIGLYFYGFSEMAFCSLTFYIMWWGGAGLAELYTSGRLPKPPLSFIFLAVALLGTGMVAHAQGQKLVMVQRFLFGGFFIILTWWALSKDFQESLKPNFLRKLLLQLGDISYSLYLIHFPLFQLFGYLWVQKMGSKPANFFVPIIFAFLSLIVAKVFYQLIEIPSHRLAKRLATN